MRNLWASREGSGGRGYPGQRPQGPGRWKAALVLALLLLAPLPARAQSTLATAIPCTAAPIYDTNTNGSTRMVTAKADGGTIYICGYTIWSAGTVNVKFISGTGTNCATNSVNLTPAFQLVTQTGISDTSPLFRGLKAEPGQDICINTSAGVAVQAILFVGTR